MVGNSNLLAEHLEKDKTFLNKDLWQKNKELLLSLSVEWSGDINDENIKNENIVALNDRKKPEELKPWTLEASDLRTDLIKFLKANWFELVDSNKHEKYRNDKNVTIEVPHQHGYFAEKTFCKILREAGYSKKIFNERKNKKKKGNKWK